MKRALKSILEMDQATAAVLCIQIAMIFGLAILDLERGL